MPKYVLSALFMDAINFRDYTALVVDEWLNECMNEWICIIRGIIIIIPGESRSTQRKVFPIFTSSVTNPTRTLLNLNRGQ
jgi:hypothetical protein